MLQAVIEIDNKPGSQVHFDKVCTFIATHEQKLELYSWTSQMIYFLPTWNKYMDMVILPGLSQNMETIWHLTWYDWYDVYIYYIIDM